MILVCRKKVCTQHKVTKTFKILLKINLLQCSCFIFEYSTFKNKIEPHITIILYNKKIYIVSDIMYHVD